MSKSLIQIYDEQKKIVEQIEKEEGQISPEQEKQLVFNEKELATMVDAYYERLHQIEEAIKNYELKILPFQNRISKLKKYELNFKTNLKNAIALFEDKSVSGLEYNLSLKKVKDKVIVKDEDIPKIPQEYKSTKVIENVDLEKIRRDILIGIEVKGASLETAYSLNKGLKK